MDTITQKYTIGTGKILLNTLYETLKQADTTSYKRKDFKKHLATLGYQFEEIKCNTYIVNIDKKPIINENRVIDNDYITIKDEKRLHLELVQYIRKYTSILVLSLPIDRLNVNCPQDYTQLCSYGYQKGTPDLQLLYQGKILFIELKTPVGAGVLSHNQVCLIQELDRNGFKTLVSNDFYDIIKSIHTYFV